MVIGAAGPKRGTKPRARRATTQVPHAARRRGGSHGCQTDQHVREGEMLELYHSINSVCAQKVRLALTEKELEAKEHLMTLRGDQFDPTYMKLNPNAVVPTVVHDGEP